MISQRSSERFFYLYSMKKAQLRKIYLEKRNELSKEEVRNLSEKIFENFVLQFKPIENQKVHIFLSIEKFNEVNTSLFINYFFQNKIRVFVPKMVGTKLIAVELTENSELEENSWGIVEPVSNEDCGIKHFDFVVTPLLCCDREGNRVGYGKGFYDKFFADLDPSTKKIGVSLFPPIEKIDDVSPSDVPLDYLVTPTEVLSFGIFTSKFTK